MPLRNYPVEYEPLVNCPVSTHGIAAVTSDMMVGLFLSVIVIQPI